MLKLPWHRLLPFALLAPPLAALAGQHDPLDASASVAPAMHESVFKSYRAHADTSVRDWKSLNDTVGRIGGWRTYAREANAPDSKPTTLPAASPEPPAANPSMPHKPAGHEHGAAREANKP